jgi:hypothetical protein
MIAKDFVGKLVTRTDVENSYGIAVNFKGKNWVQVLWLDECWVEKFSANPDMLMVEQMINLAEIL